MTNLKEPLLSDEVEKNPDFGFNDYSTLLATIIRDPNLKTPFTIAVYGNWGSGKTTLMDAINTKLNKSCEELKIEYQNLVNVHPIWFSAWEFEKLQTPLWAIFLNRIIMEIEKMDPNKKRNKNIINLGKGLLLLTSDLLLSKTIGIKTSDLEKVRDKVWKDIEEIKNLREKLQKYVCDALLDDPGKRSRLVIFVDDLDRCLPEQSIHIFESIKLFLNCKKCVYVIGIDREQIRRIFQKKFDSQNETVSPSYVEKFVQLEFDLPPKTSDEVKEFISRKAPDNLKNTPKVIELISKFIEPNPRKIKRWLNSVLFLEKLFVIKKEELTKVDGHAPEIDVSLASIWLFLKAYYPRFSNLIASDNSILNEAIRTAKDTETTEKRVGNFELEEELLKFLIELEPNYNETQLKDIIHLSKLTPSVVSPEEELVKKKSLINKTKDIIVETDYKIEELLQYQLTKKEKNQIDGILSELASAKPYLLSLQRRLEDLKKEKAKGSIDNEIYYQKSEELISDIEKITISVVAAQDKILDIENKLIDKNIPKYSTVE